MMTVLMADGEMCSGAPKQRTIEGKQQQSFDIREKEKLRARAVTERNLLMDRLKRSLSKERLNEETGNDSRKESFGRGEMTALYPQQVERKHLLV
jgi:hypothetical protein